MALHPGESGSRRLRQGVERLAVPVLVQRGTIIVGQALRLPSRALANSHQRLASDALALQFIRVIADYFDFA